MEQYEKIKLHFEKNTQRLKVKASLPLRQTPKYRLLAQWLIQANIEGNTFNCVANPRGGDRWFPSQGEQ